MICEQTHLENTWGFVHRYQAIFVVVRHIPGLTPLREIAIAPVLDESRVHLDCVVVYLPHIIRFASTWRRQEKLSKQLAATGQYL